MNLDKEINLYNADEENCIYKNKKSGKLYRAIDKVINCTNAQDGQVMILYDDTNFDYYVRDVNEFKEKFEHVDITCLEWLRDYTED